MHPSDAAPAVIARPSSTGRIARACQAARGRRLPLVAAAFASGIAVYFGLPAEPGPVSRGLIAATALACAGLAWRGRAGAGFVAMLAAACLAGLVVAQMRTLAVAAPVLDFRYYGPVEGTIAHIDRSASGAPRITLAAIRLDDMSPDRTPRRVRLSVPDGSGVVPRPGLRVMTTAHLMPPAGPAEPGGFDFQRHAWFLSLGAIGYAAAPLLRADAEVSPRPVSALRTAIAAHLRAELPGAAGEVAAAITTGDRSGLPAEAVADLRASNLAHLLAISGLHMGLLAGFVFWAVRGGLALLPRVALRHPTRAWAALVALPVAAFYLALSGAGVATQRAFVMAAVMLIAIVLGRRALSMRSVALAALAVLFLRPESLTGPGFQMSFSATAALVVAFRWLSDRGLHGVRGWRGAVLSLLLSSVVAGAATAPFAALHFNRLGHYGVIANLLAVPAMGFAVMPLLVIGLLLAPLSAGGPFLALAGMGIDWILLVAERIADLPGATSAIRAPGQPVLPALGAGVTLVLVCWGRARLVGVATLVVAAVLWWSSPRPDVLISDDGRLVGRMGPEGRVLSREAGAGFVAEVWLENDGDDISQEEAARRDGHPRDGLPLILAVRGKRDLPDALGACRDAWLVAPVDVAPGEVPPGWNCRILDPRALGRTGAIALYADGATWREVTARDRQGARPWSPGEP